MTPIKQSPNSTFHNKQQTISKSKKNQKTIKSQTTHNGYKPSLAFCNVKKDSVIPALNANSIYEVPSIYSKAGLDNILLEHLGFNASEYPLNLKPWKNLIDKIQVTKVLLHQKLRIGTHDFFQRQFQIV